MELRPVSPPSNPRLKGSGSLKPLACWWQEAQATIGQDWAQLERLLRRRRGQGYCQKSTTKHEMWLKMM
jgi:hypothetical protein